MNFQVGQVIFIVLKTKQQVLPARIVEEIKKKTLKGEETSYNAEVPIGKHLKTVPIKDLNCEIFCSTKEAKDFLMSNTSDFIDSMMSQAETLAQERFEQPLGFSESVNGHAVIEEPKGEMKVELEDGVIANIKVPEGL